MGNSHFNGKQTKAGNQDQKKEERDSKSKSNQKISKGGSSAVDKNYSRDHEQANAGSQDDTTNDPESPKPGDTVDNTVSPNPGKKKISDNLMEQQQQHQIQYGALKKEKIKQDVNQNEDLDAEQQQHQVAPPGEHIKGEPPDSNMAKEKDKNSFGDKNEQNKKASNQAGELDPKGDNHVGPAPPANNNPLQVADNPQQNIAPSKEENAEKDEKKALDEEKGKDEGDTTREKESPKPVSVFLDPLRTPSDWVKKMQAPLQSLLEKKELYIDFQDNDQNNPTKWLGIAHKSRFARKDIDELNKYATETPIVIFHHEHTQLEIDNALYIKYSPSGSQHYRLELMDSKKTSNDIFLKNLKDKYV